MRQAGLVAAVFCAALAAGCRSSERPAEPSVGQRVADAFLEKLRAGQWDAAWQSTTAEFKSDEGRESFAREVRSQPALRGPLTFLSYEVTELNGLKRGQCMYQAAAIKNSPAAMIRVLVAQEAGEWRVDGLFVE